MHDDVSIVSADDFSSRGNIVPASYHLRFPARWRATPVQNRYSAAIEAETIAWLARHGIGRTLAEREKLRKFACGMYGGCSLPTAPYSTALLVTQFISLWLFWDDVQVEEETAWSIDDVVDALTREHLPREHDRYVAAWADLGERLERTQSAGWLVRLGRTMREWLENAKRETLMARAFRLAGVCPDVDELFECRTVSIGMFPTFHLIELTEGIELPDSFHDHAAAQALKRSASRLVGMGNDLCGIAKDIQNRWLNLVLVTAERSGSRLDASFARVVTLHNEEVRAFDRLAARLPRFGTAVDPFVSGWVQAVRYNVYGFALWESLAERYQELRAIIGGTALVAELVEEPW